MWDNIDVVVGKIYKGKRYLDIFIGNIKVILYIYYYVYLYVLIIYVYRYIVYCVFVGIMYIVVFIGKLLIKI